MFISKDSISHTERQNINLFFSSLLLRFSFPFLSTKCSKRKRLAVGLARPPIDYVTKRIRYEMNGQKKHTTSIFNYNVNKRKNTISIWIRVRSMKLPLYVYILVFFFFFFIWLNQEWVNIKTLNKLEQNNLPIRKNQHSLVMFIIKWSRISKIKWF